MGSAVNHLDDVNFFGLDSSCDNSGGKFSFGYATATLSALSGATATATSLIPAKSIVYGVTTRVITLITGATAYKVGDGTTANLFANAGALTAGTTTDFADHLATFAGGKLYTAATNIVLTATTSNFTAGAVKIVVWYATMVAPVS